MFPPDGAAMRAVGTRIGRCARREGRLCADKRVDGATFLKVIYEGREGGLLSRERGLVAAAACAAWELSRRRAAAAAAAATSAPKSHV